MAIRGSRILLSASAVILLVGLAEVVARIAQFGQWPPADPARGFLPFTSVIRESIDSRGQAVYRITDA